MIEFKNSPGTQQVLSQPPVQHQPAAWPGAAKKIEKSLQSLTMGCKKIEKSSQFLAKGCKENWEVIAKLMQKGKVNAKQLQKGKGN